MYCGPVLDPVLSLVLRVHARVHAFSLPRSDGSALPQALGASPRRIRGRAMHHRRQSLPTSLTHQTALMPRNSWTGFGDTLNTTLVYAQPSAFNGEVDRAHLSPQFQHPTINADTRQTWLTVDPSIGPRARARHLGVCTMHQVRIRMVHGWRPSGRRRSTDPCREHVSLRLDQVLEEGSKRD